MKQKNILLTTILLALLFFSLGSVKADSNATINHHIYIVPYLGDIDGNVNPAWFYFYNNLTDFYDQNNLTVGISFFPGSMSNDPTYVTAIDKMYNSPNIELIQKGNNGNAEELVFETLTAQRQKEILLEGQTSFYNNMSQNLNTNNISMSMTLDLIHDKFTYQVLNVSKELGFNNYFDLFYDNGIGPLNPTPDYDVVQYGISFSQNGDTGPQTVYQTEDQIINELNTYVRLDVPMKMIGNDPVIPLWAHQQDFHNETSTDITQEKWDLYRKVMLDLNNNPNVTFITPQQMYAISHNIPVQKRYITSAPGNNTFATNNTIVNNTPADISNNFTTSMDLIGNQTNTVDATNNTSTLLQITPIENVSSNITIISHTINPHPTSQSGITFVKSIDLTADDSLNSNLSEAQINLYYNDINTSALDESTFKIYFYNSTQDNWDQLQSTGVDTSSKFVWGNTTHFSEYAIFATPAPATQSGSGSSSNSGSSDSNSNGNYVPKTFDSVVVNNSSATNNEISSDTNSLPTEDSLTTTTTTENSSSPSSETDSSNAEIAPSQPKQSGITGTFGKTATIVLVALLALVILFAVFRIVKRSKSQNTL